MMESRTMRKWYWVWDFDKEERWLNEMAMEGWALCGVGFCSYTFERCEPGEYTVRTEMRGADPEYVSFMEEIGAEYVGRMLQWIYFRRRAEDGPFELFDLDAKISHLERIARMLWVIGIANLLIGVFNTLANGGFGIINLLCATLLMYALGRIEGKKEALERQRELHE